MEFIKELKESHASVMDLIRPPNKRSDAKLYSGMSRAEFDNHTKKAKYERNKVK